MLEYVDTSTGNKYIQGELFRRGGSCNIFYCSQYDSENNLINENLILKKLIRQDGANKETFKIGK